VIPTRIDAARLIAFAALREKQCDQNTMCKALKIRERQLRRFQAEYRRLKDTGERLQERS
jgi:hypothetical protein